MRIYYRRRVEWRSKNPITCDDALPRHLLEMTTMDGPPPRKPDWVEMTKLHGCRHRRNDGWWVRIGKGWYII